MAYSAATAKAALKTRLQAAFPTVDDDTARANVDAMAGVFADWITDVLPLLTVTTTGLATGVTSGGATAPTSSTGGVT